MEIKKKIAIQFTVIVAIIIAISLLIIYFLFASIRKNDFKERLNNKALLIAEITTETDKQEQNIIKHIEAKNPTRLPNEKIVVFNENNDIIYSTLVNDTLLDLKQIVSRIKESKNIYIKNEINELVGCYHIGDNENVIVICSANDYFGFRKLKRLGIILIGVFITSTLIIFFTGRLFASKALKPISNIVQQVNNIDSSNLQERVTSGNGKDEITLLANTFNDMLKRLELAFLNQKEFIANASHELRTPLTTITGSLEVTLLNERSQVEYKQALISTLEEVKKLNRLTNRLLTLLHTNVADGDSSFIEVRIDDILWKTRTEYLKNHSNHIVDISFDETIKGEDNFKALGNNDLLRTAFFNLMDNGCKYSPNKKIDIHLATIGHNLQITFHDNGIGIPENEIDNILQPFYRASNVENNSGHGIGLSLVQRIILLHNGHLSIKSELDQGTTITLLFQLLSMT